MASLNSHRRRQSYNRYIDRGRYQQLMSAIPAGPVVMMPSKDTSGNTYSVNSRDFANLNDMLHRSYTGTTIKSKYSHRDITQRDIFIDTLLTNPAGMNNVYGPQRGNTRMDYLYHNRRSSNPSTTGLPPVYMLELAAGQGLLSYSRRNVGTMNDGSFNYKHVRGKGYMKVMDFGNDIGGNIKSRQTALKWIAGMWREKK